MLLRFEFRHYDSPEGAREDAERHQKIFDRVGCTTILEEEAIEDDGLEVAVYHLTIFPKEEHTLID